MSLILLPNLLADDADIDLWLCKKIKSIISSLDGLICENEKNARRYLLRFLAKEDFQKIKLNLLNEHTKQNEINEIVNNIKNEKWGIISDAGLPCVADPGSYLVRLAREKNISIQAISGPSSIMLALMSSGLNGQKFYFQGYLPRKEKELIKKIQFLENESKTNNSTQIFIEAPYRSDKMFEILKKTLRDQTDLCVAINLTSRNEKVITKKMLNWRKTKLVISKNPTVFLFQA